jgi:dolichol-phosphate mannosyltransferase
MEIHPKEIRIFMGLMAIYDCDIVIGSKRHPQSRVYYPWYRRVLSWLFQQLVKKLFSLDVTDTQVGIKLLRADVVKAILPDLQIDRYGFDLEILSLAKIHGFDSVLEAPIQMDYFGGGGKRPFFRDIAHVFLIGTSLLKDVFRLHSRLKKIQPIAKENVRAIDRKRAG